MINLIYELNAVNISLISSKNIVGRVVVTVVVKQIQTFDNIYFVKVLLHGWKIILNFVALMLLPYLLWKFG